MNTIKIILLFICGVFSTLMFLCGLFSTIAIIKTADFGSGKTIVISISIFLSLLFGLLSMLCCRKMYLLIHPKQINSLDNIITPPSPEQTKEERAVTNTMNAPNQIVLSSSTSISHVDRENVILNSDESPTIQYVETGNVIHRADGKTITDEEVPYLIQVGYEESLEKEKLYNGQVLDLSFMQERDKNKKEYTRIPTYQELSKVQNRDSYVSLAELSFLSYINGLPLINPFIAQKWYYEYNLNYTKTIINLISNGLLTVEHACIDKLKADELKAILKKFNYPTNGKKEELLLRIRANISQLDIDNYFDNAKYFSATPKGHELIKNYEQ